MYYFRQNGTARANLPPRLVYVTITLGEDNFDFSKITSLASMSDNLRYNVLLFSS